LFIKTIKECTTNAIRHGNAKTIDVILSDVTISISNDGGLPKNIQFGNGLNSIKIEAEQLDFTTTIISIDKFTLRLEKLTN